MREGLGAVIAPSTTPITLVTAQIHSNSLFHDYTQVGVSCVGSVDGGGGGGSTLFSLPCSGLPHYSHFYHCAGFRLSSVGPSLHDGGDEYPLRNQRQRNVHAAAGIPGYGRCVWGGGG